MFLYFTASIHNTLTSNDYIKVVGGPVMLPLITSS